MKPEGVEVTEYADETWLAYSDMDVENGGTNIMCWMQKKNETEARERMIMEVEATFSWNNFATQSIEEVQQRQIGNREVFYFRYTSSQTEHKNEGYRVWVPFDDGNTLMVTIEKGKCDIESIDIETYLNTIFADIQESY